MKDQLDPEDWDGAMHDEDRDGCLWSLGLWAVAIGTVLSLLL